MSRQDAEPELQPERVLADANAEEELNVRRTIYSLVGLLIAAALLAGGYFWGVSEGREAVYWRDQSEREIVQKALTLIRENKTQNARELLESRERALKPRG
jgi:hypothetical protein